MKIFLKITFFIILLLLLAIVTALPVYKNLLFDKARLFLSEQLSDNTDYSIDIGKLSFSYMSTVNLCDVRISKKTSPMTDIVNINEIKIDIDISALLINKKLETTLRLEGIEKNNILSNAILKTYSLKADTYKNVFCPGLLTDIAIIDAAVSCKGHNIERLYGDIALNNLRVTGARAALSYKDNFYLVKIVPARDNKDSFELLLRAENINLSGGITKSNDKNFLINYLSGNLFCLKLDLFGHIKNADSAAVDTSLEGEVRIDLSRLNTLPGNAGQSFEKINITGFVISEISFKSTDPLFKEYDLTASLLSSRIILDEITLTDMKAGMSLKNGRLKIPDMTSSFYGGKIYGDIKLDITEKGLPYILMLSVENMFLDEFIEDVTGKFSPVYGNTSAKLSLQGYSTDNRTMEGTLDVEILDADLGPMPLLTPLLGDIYSILRDTMIAPENRVNISQAYGEFTIKNRRISTHNALLWGNNIAIYGDGHMDFDGTIDFTLENKFTQSPIQQVGNWQTTLRDTIIRFGKALGKARLKGTLQKPEWKFDYFDNE
jgi:hypothetical protein